MGRICIIDYGVGNIHSALKGLRRFAPDTILSEDPAEIREAAALVLPGQGAFEAGMEGLKVRGLLDVVKEAGARGKPILGICLGAQLLLERGHEFGDWEGLGFIPGECVHFPKLHGGAKTPHMGWNEIEEPMPDAWKDTALEGMPDGTPMYFIHSYILQPKNSSHVLALTEHGGVRFPSVIRTGAIYGCQFHPEKSADAGLLIIRNFVAIVRSL